MEYDQKYYQKKTVLITGASRGIGAACAKLFAQNGWQVAVHYHKSEHQAKVLAEEINAAGGRALAFFADVRDGAQMQGVVQAAETCLGKLNALVCCAGIAKPQGLFVDTAEADWDDLFSVNAKGTYFALKAALPGMTARKSGAVVLVSSVWGVVGGSCEAAYSASKASLVGLTKALAKELGPSGIRVNCVAPGVIQTDMNAHLSQQDMADLADATPLGRIGQPEEAAEAVFFLASDVASFVTGQVLGVDGGFAG